MMRQDDSVARAKEVFGAIKSWLVLKGATDPENGNGIPQGEMAWFLDTACQPSLGTAEKEWLLKSWPGRIADGNEISFFAQHGEQSRSSSRAGNAPPSHSAGHRAPTGPVQLPAVEEPAEGRDEQRRAAAMGDRQLDRSISWQPDTDDIHLPTPKPLPSPTDVYFPTPDLHPPTRSPAASVNFSPRSDTVPNQSAKTSPQQQSSRHKILEMINMPGSSIPRHDPLKDLAVPPDRLATKLLSARWEEQRPPAHAPRPDEDRRRMRMAQTGMSDSRATEFVGESEAMEKIAHMSFKMDGMQSQLQALRKENYHLQQESSRPKTAAANGIALDAQEFKITIRLDDAENLPTSASLWEEGHEWQSALELCATLSLTDATGRVDETMSSETRRRGERASWDQCFVLLADSSRHADVLLQLLRPLPDGHGPPQACAALDTGRWGCQSCGSLRLPLPELLARGPHQGWFVLSDDRGKPFRSAQGQQAAVHLKVDVEERETARLRAQLSQTQAELEYVKGQLPEELREEVMRVRRENQLLQATVTDLRQELEWSKQTLKLHGKLGEEKLLEELAALQTQLRSAFVTHQAPAEQSAQLRRQLSSWQSSHGQEEEEEKEGGGGGAGTARQRGGRRGQLQHAAATGGVAESFKVDGRASGRVGGMSLAGRSAGEEGGREQVWGGEGAEVLRVVVGACVDLRVTKQGRCNPYCSLVLGRTRKTSQVREDTLDPIFDASFEFDVGPASASRGRNLTITVLSRADPSVLRGDAHPEDLRIGTAVLAVDAVREAPGMALDAWLPIAPSLLAAGLSQTAGALHLQAALLPAAPLFSPGGLPTSTRL